MAEDKKPKDQDSDKEKDAEKANASPAASGPRKPTSAEIAQAVRGLRFRTNKALPVLDNSTGKPVIEDGKEKMRYIPDLRQMAVSDVLSAAYVGGELVIVSKDGAKHRIGRAA